MEFVTIGSIIQSMRAEKNTITRKKLAHGLCSEQTLFGIEAGQFETDVLLLDILMQRLGLRSGFCGSPYRCVAISAGRRFHYPAGIYI